MDIYKIEEFNNLIKTRENIYLWGTGYFSDAMKDYFDSLNVKISAFIDNDEKKQGTIFKGENVVSFSNIKTENIFIIIATGNVATYAIEKQLIEANVSDNNFVCFKDYEIWNAVFYSKADLSLCEKSVELKDKFKGKRAFVIGNGPSLTPEVLGKIAGEYSFACNYALDMVGINGWKPTGYIINEYNSWTVIGKYSNRAPSELADYFFIGSNCKDKEVLAYLEESERYFYSNKLYQKSGNKIPDEIDIKKPLLECCTSLHPMIQIMIYMGFSELYLVGCDFKFVKSFKENGIITRENNISNNHSSLQPSDSGCYSVDRIIVGYKLIKQYCDKHSIKILNATHNSALDVFEKIELESLFK